MTSAVDSVRVEYRQDSPSVAVQAPRVSWVTRTEVPGWRQLAAELAWNDGVRTVNFQVDGDASVLVAWPFADLAPRQRGSLRVRTQGVDGWTGWSEELPVVAAFLGDGEWRAPFICLPEPSRHAQPVLLRHEFEVAPGLARATLYATALGVYQAHVNGQAVDDQLLKPGWTPYAVPAGARDHGRDGCAHARPQCVGCRAHRRLVHGKLRLPGPRQAVLR